MFGYDYTAEMAEQFIAQFHQYLEEYNKNSGQPYVVTASLGYAISDPDENYSQEYYIKISDDLLYQNKRARKEQFGNNLNMRRE